MCANRAFRSVAVQVLSGFRGPSGRSLWSRAGDMCSCFDVSKFEVKLWTSLLNGFSVEKNIPRVDCV